MSQEEKGGEIVAITGPQFGGKKRNREDKKKPALTSPPEPTPPQESKPEPIPEPIPEVVPEVKTDEQSGLGLEALALAMLGGEEEESSQPAYETPTSVDPTLTRILRWKRPHDSAGVTNFTIWLQAELTERGAKDVHTTTANNIAIIMPAKAGHMKVPQCLFSCHVDTVHSECSGEQEIVYDASLGHIFLDKSNPNKGSCLGADDGAGIWLMLQMISAKVPGAYIFHQGEERGGVGASAMLKAQPDWIKQFKIAVAFDRKDVGDVIYVQGGGECASYQCAKALAEALNAGDATFNYKPCTTGVFTDTKVYRGHIPECLNISVGYENAHGSDEYLNYEHLLALRDVLINLDWEALPVHRTPRDIEYGHSYGGGYGGYGGRKGRSDWGHGGSIFPEGHKDYGGYNGKVYDSATGQWKDEKVKEVEKAGDERFTKNKGKGKGKDKPTWSELVTTARSSGEPTMLQELRSLNIDELEDLSRTPDAAYSTIMALYIELEAAYAKIETYRGLAGLD